MAKMQPIELTLADKLTPVIERIIGKDALDGDTDGKMLLGFVLITDWQALDGSRGLHVVGPVNQPQYITRALLGEAARMNDEEDDMEEIEDA